MKTAIYCRVSTDNQEKEGSSLESQREACLKFCADNNYLVSHLYMETYSGLSLERPKLAELRQLAADRGFECIVCYTPDRLSRIGEDILTIAKEFFINGVKLFFVKDGFENSFEGKLIAFIQGWASELEVKKIVERTSRGLRKRAESGKLPSGHRGRLYGYNYIPGKGPGEGIRYVNEDQAKWIRQIFQWYVSEGLGIERLCFRLKEQNITSPAGKPSWSTATISKTLKNRAYIGETYVYTKYLVKGQTKSYITRPREQWISIPGATPAIISQEIFEAAQARMETNKEHARRNTRAEYLLAGRIVCGKCGRQYWGFLKRTIWNKKVYPHRYYHCAGKFKRVAYDTCDNRNWSADKLEIEVWAEISKVINNPDILLQELETQRNIQKQLAGMEKEVMDIQKRLLILEKEQETLLQWALKGFPELTVIKENERINNLRAQMNTQKGSLYTKMQTIRQNAADTDKIRRVCEMLKERSADLSYKSRVLILEVLRIRVVINGGKYVIHGAVPPEYGPIVSTLPASSSSNKPCLHFTI